MWNGAHTTALLVALLAWTAAGYGADDPYCSMEMYEMNSGASLVITYGKGK